jgi:4-diphosphocytidyl-2-C-methyl-D-erythritol kinase
MEPDQPQRSPNESKPSFPLRLSPFAFRIQCPPKVNLYLKVVGRREDGYHELETVFQSVDGGDTLYAAPAEDLSLRCSEPSLPTDESNLVMRAARLLRDRYPEAADWGAALTLVKRTPAGAGMGGGSVDAAAALVLLCRLWGLSLSGAELAGMAAALGSDVPFFLQGGTSLARGRGEELSALPTPALWLVLVKPPVGVRTPWAYRQWRVGTCSGPGVEEFIQALAGGPGEIASVLRNDLEAGVVAQVPEIRAARDWLLEQGALGACMTGSGSAVFGITQGEEHAREISASAVGAPGRVWTARCLSAAEAALVPKRLEESEPPVP